DSIKKQIEDINFREKSIPSKLESCNLQIGKMINKKENSITSIDNLKITINENRLASELAQKNYEDECELGYVAINELENYKYQSTSSKKLEVILSELISKNSNILSEYKIKSKFIFPNSGDNERVDYTFTANRIEKPLFYLTDYLKQEIEDLELLITKGDREIFEGILLEDLSRKILAIIHNSKIWIKEINNLMDNMESSSSLKLDLKWEPKKAESEGELGTQQLINYLNTKDTLTESEKERFRNHFISKIKKAINLSASSGGDTSYYNVIKEVLDFRKWYTFTLFYFKNNEKRKEMTDNNFYQLSGGEKAISMYLPLLAALYVRYKHASQTSPRIVAM
ncbi:MAG: SbcC/MukB-like Walker B domain-containing protein, partial [Cetobacterium sp.]